MSTLHKVLAFSLSSLLIVAVGLALVNRLAAASPAVKKVLGA